MERRVTILCLAELCSSSDCRCSGHWIPSISVVWHRIRACMARQGHCRRYAGAMQWSRISVIGTVYRHGRCLVTGEQWLPSPLVCVHFEKQRNTNGKEKEESYETCIQLQDSKLIILSLKLSIICVYICIALHSILSLVCVPPSTTFRRLFYPCHPPCGASAACACCPPNSRTVLLGYGSLFVSPPPSPRSRCLSKTPSSVLEGGCPCISRGGVCHLPWC